MRAIAVLLIATASLLLAGAGLAGTGRELTDAEKRKLKQTFAAALAKKKGPYTPNYCVCQNGDKRPVQGPTAASASRAARTRASVRPIEPRRPKRSPASGCTSRTSSPRPEPLGHLSDHHDLVRGYVLEKFFVDTNPTHKLAEMKAYGGLSGAEYEARDAPLFFERYLSDPTFDANRHYLLAYELQRRYFVRNEQGDIQSIHNLAGAAYQADPKFKRSATTHNQLSAALLPRIRATATSSRRARRGRRSTSSCQIEAGLVGESRSCR
jgi:hypothetical protein